MLISILKKIKFDVTSDRIGPDCPFTHWTLYYKKSMKKICEKKFKKFDNTSEFRPGAFAICCSKISIGRNVVVRPNSMFFADHRYNEERGFITIDDNVLLGSGIHIYTSNHKFSLPDKEIPDQGFSEPKNVHIKSGAWIGANCVILPGVSIGQHSVVGAGSIVTKSIPDYVVAVGNPARIIKQIV